MLRINPMMCWGDDGGIGPITLTTTRHTSGRLTFPGVAVFLSVPVALGRHRVPGLPAAP